jgi:hypothetical protein
MKCPSKSEVHILMASRTSGKDWGTTGSEKTLKIGHFSRLTVTTSQRGMRHTHIDYLPRCRRSPPSRNWPLIFMRKPM